LTEPVEAAFKVEPLESVSFDISGSANEGGAALTRNLKPETRNPANAMLAFAGDPAALGMMVPDILGPDLIEAEIMALPEPVYPVLSRKRGEQGRVVIEVEISAEGKVLKARITSSSSYPRLDSAALEAVKTAIFGPAIEYGRPVVSMTKVAYRFELEGK